MRLAIIISVALLLSACDQPKYPLYETDQVKRAEIFQACLKAVPPGPARTTYNDWAEVVNECADAAYYQSMYCYENCPPAPKRPAQEKEGE